MEANSDKSGLKKVATRGRGRGRSSGSRIKKNSKKLTNRVTKNKSKDLDEAEVEDEIESEDIEQENNIQNYSSPIQSPTLNKEEIESEITSTLSFVSASTRLNVPLHNNQPLQWDHRVNLIGEKCPNPRIHLCDHCNQPVLIYGRMIPCKHVFCYACAKANEDNCLRCNVKVIRIEKNGLGRVFMCNYESCRRTYLSQRDLQAHVQHRHLRRSSNANNGISSTTSTLSSNQSNSNSLSSSNHPTHLVTSQKSSPPPPLPPPPTSSSSSSSSSSVINRLKTHSSSKVSFQNMIPIASSRCNLMSVPLQEELKVSNSVSTNSNFLSQSQVTSGHSTNHFSAPPPQPFLTHSRAHISWPTLHHGSIASTGHLPFSSPTLNPFSPSRFESFPNVGTTNWPLPHPPFNRPFFP